MPLVTFKTKVLVAISPDLPEYLQRSVIFINPHTADGAFGIVLNKPFPHDMSTKIINEIGAGNSSKVYEGGPCRKTMGFIIHTSDYCNSNTYKLSNDTYMTTGSQILDDMAASMEPEDFMMVIGHCQWEADQLEYEVANGYWAVTEAKPEYFFAGALHSETIWETAIKNASKERVKHLLL